MTEVKRYYADRVPVKWDEKWHMGEVQEVYLASDYDALLAQARRLRAMLKELWDGEGTMPVAKVHELILNTADLEVTP
jgi:hypothetical protein